LFDHQLLILLYPNHLFLHFVLDLLPIHFLFPVLMMSHFYLVRHYPILDQLILSLVMRLPILMVSLLDLNSIQILFHQQVAIFLVVFALDYDPMSTFATISSTSTIIATITIMTISTSATTTTAAASTTAPTAVRTSKIKLISEI